MNTSAVNLKRPNAFLIGATKSGTTSLAQMLGQHPKVFLPDAAFFFSKDDFYRRGMDWYQDSYFAKSASSTIRIDSTPDYLLRGEKVIPRILNHFDEPQNLKFIAILRNPIERAYSHYWMAVRRGTESLSFLDAIRREVQRKVGGGTESTPSPGQTGRYIAEGKYASNLKPYLKRFDRSQFHILLFDDFAANSEHEIRKLFVFLDLDAEIPLEPLHANMAAKHRSSSLRSYTNNRDHPTRMILRKLLPAKLRKIAFRRLIELNKAPFTPPPIPQEAVNILTDSLKVEIDELEQLLDRDLSHWF